MIRKKEIAKTDPRDISIGAFTLTATGLQIEGTPSFDDWQRAGAFIERAGSGVQWWIGDWLNYGEGRPEWGDGYQQAASITGYDEGTLMNLKSIASKFEFSRRRENLSWAHHETVAGLPVESQDALLDLAEETDCNRAALRKEVRKIRLAEGREEKQLPDGVFNLIYADPPWRYEHSKTTSREIENHYPTMELEAICELPVSQLAADDCVLFMWATSPKLAESMQVVESWGFTYRTCMVWVKDKIGMGYYARQKHELLLICAKGNPSVPDESSRPPSVIEAPRAEHSRKPDEFYGIIESMYPRAQKVELFCRRPRQGWSIWGNEV